MACRVWAVLAGCLLVLPLSTAFGPSTSLALHRSSSSSNKHAGVRISMEYVPDGLSKQEWEKLKKKESEANKGKNLGAIGTNRFQSRSLSAWQADGGKHLFPVDPKKVKKGEIALKNVPYMQRGGSWDDSDLKGVQKKKWTKADEEYERSGLKAYQSVSIFGGANLPWNAKYKPMEKGALDPRKAQAKAGQRPSVGKKDEERLKGELNKEKKGFFGLF